MQYNPHDHYWFITGDATQVFSSRRRLFVLVNDAEYVNWLLDPEHQTTTIASLDELRDVLAPYMLALQGEKPSLQFDRDPYLRALFEWAFVMTNDVRTLKGQATITKQQFVDFLRNFLP